MRDSRVRDRPLALDVIGSSWLARALLVILGAGLIALAARVAIPLPFSPVPVTGQTFAVLLVGASLGARLGAASVALYVLEGAAGLPVYAGGVGGMARLVGPTGGYLIGFVVAAGLLGALAERGLARRFATAIASMVVAEIVIYLFGLAWLARFPLQTSVIDAGLVPFIPGDIYKAVLAAVALPAASRLRRR